MSRWIPDLQPRLEAGQRAWSEWTARNFEKLSRWTSAIPAPEVITYGASITDDAGDGTPHGDLNATDFTGHDYADTQTPTALRIESNAVVSFGHKTIAYMWQGPSGVTVGVGGGYTAVSTDLTPIGTADHTLLVNRSLADQHPTSAITNLDTHQANQDSRLTALEQHPPRTDNPHQVTHDQLVGQSPEPDPHPQYQLKKPMMLLGGVTDGFTLNTTDSKLVNYTLSGEEYTSGSIDAADGEITIPSDGTYSVNANVLGLQGNDTKEEWIELKIDVAIIDPERYTIGFVDVSTDKTTTRQVASFASRNFSAGQVLSLYMWASAGLGTFTVLGVTFEVRKILEQSA